MLREDRRVGRIGREAAAEVDLPARATEDLLVRREDGDAPVGPQVDLGARAGEALARDALFDDAAEREVRAIPLGKGLDRRPQPGVRVGRVVHRAQVDDDVAVTRPAVVVLDDDPRGVRSIRADRVDRIDHVVGRPDILAAERHRHARVDEQATTGALERQRPKLRCGAVDRHVEREREIHLGIGDVPRLDEGGPRPDVLADPGDEVGPVEQPGRDGPGRPVVDLEDRDPGAGGVSFRRWNELEVVVEDLGQRRARRDVDDLA